MKEIRPCSPKLGDPRPAGCRIDEPVDCEMGVWTRWSSCTAHCDGGVQRRTRVVVQRASHGGRGCLAALSEVNECNRHLCTGGSGPIDCEVGQWEEWGLCNKCDGERTRFRNILRYASNGGRTCDQMSIREVDKCPRSCNGNLYCTWASWEDWGDCSKTCGRGGKRRRRRYLHLTQDREDVLAPEPEAAPTTSALEEPLTPSLATVPPMPIPAKIWSSTTRPPPPSIYGGGMSVHRVGEMSAVTAAYDTFQKTKDLEFHTVDVILSFAGGFTSLSLIVAACRRWTLQGVDRQALTQDPSWTA